MWSTFLLLEAEKNEEFIVDPTSEEVNLSNNLVLVTAFKPIGRAS